MQQLANLSGVSKQTIIDVEGQRGNPTIDTLERVAGALGMTVRALVSDVGADVMHKSGDAARWHVQKQLDVRRLDSIYGSGYVVNSLIRLVADRHGRSAFTGPRGMLRHCFVIEGEVELGPEGRTVVAGVGDFVRFPGEGAHIIAPVAKSSLVFVCSTMPQQSLSGLEDPF